MSIRLGQGLIADHFRRSRRRAFSVMRSFRMIAVMATLPVSLLKNMFGLGSGRPTMASGNSLSGE
jgi:hypothetical protein